MNGSFQKGLIVKPPRDIYGPMGAFLFCEVIL